MKTLVVLLVLAVLAGLWLHHENGKLARSFEKANRVAGELKNTVGMLKNQLQVVAIRAEKNERAQVDLRQKLAAAGDRAVRREQTITRLLNENEAFRRWYSADLPDAVRRVHHRAACASAGSCLERLPGGEPVPDAGERSAQ
ncbi:Rz-like lysis system protein LysB [Atlantibacter hermannii]|uniref:Rz-like lysis system protein LysB n=1 Tax=Atlantibacter hermannii TaxID=565 RepID=UPI0028A9933C|nr:Rz-like lysis system protein LysB [Atlantibacter hermannii]